MKIAAIETLHCDAGFRVNSFVKVSTDEGITGWSEYMEGYGALGLTATIAKMAERLIGQDPRPVERITAWLYAATRQAPGGVNAQAIAAIENALVDVKARALGIPVCEMLGGPVRDRFEVYWSHCGTYRVRHPEHLKEWTGADRPIREVADFVAQGREVRERGFRGLKTNIVRFDGPRPYIHGPGTNAAPGFPSLNIDGATLRAAIAQMSALREGGGPEMNLHLDLNFNYKTEGFTRLARALEPLDLTWLEIDTYDAAALADIRRAARVPIASCESLYGRRQYRPFFEQRAVDVAIVDVPWNGILESVKIAAMAEAYEINVAPHNFNGHLGSLMSAHFCAVIPNFRVMEIDIDDVAWKDDIVIKPPLIENGEFLLPTGPGWGAEVDEAFVRAHPPKR